MPKPRNDGNRLVGELLVRAPPVCLGPSCKVMNQLIVGLSPSSETTYRLAIISLYDGTL
jgi:hypothetical protein